MAETPTTAREAPTQGRRPPSDCGPRASMLTWLKDLMQQRSVPNWVAALLAIATTLTGFVGYRTEARARHREEMWQRREQVRNAIDQLTLDDSRSWEQLDGVLSVYGEALGDSALWTSAPLYGRCRRFPLEQLDKQVFGQLVEKYNLSALDRRFTLLDEQFGPTLLRANAIARSTLKLEERRASARGGMTWKDYEQWTLRVIQDPAYPAGEELEGLCLRSDAENALRVVEDHVLEDFNEICAHAAEVLGLPYEPMTREGLHERRPYGKWSTASGEESWK